MVEERIASYDMGGDSVQQKKQYTKCTVERCVTIDYAYIRVEFHVIPFGEIMTFDDAMRTGFLNLSDEEATKVLEDIFDNDDAGARLDAGVALFGTFIPQDKLEQVLDLAAIVLDANEELDAYEGGDDEVDLEE